MSATSGKLVLRQHPWRYFWKDIRTHYPHSKGVVGRSIFYGIYRGYQRLGLIGVQETTLPMKAVVKEVYGADKLTPDLRKQYRTEIVNNSIFKLYIHERFLASKILSLFVKQLHKDFYKKFDTWLRGINSLTYGENEHGVERTGISYQAANWKYLGLSKGGKKTWAKGHVVYKKVDPKHVWFWKYPPHNERKQPPPNLFEALSNALENSNPLPDSPHVERGLSI